MPTSLDQIVNIQISQQTATVPQAGFGIELIIGTSDRFSDLVRYYTDPSAYIADGGLISDPEYIRLAEAFEQAIQPEQVGVGKFTPSVAQIDTITPTPVDSTLYKVTIAGVDYSFTSGMSTTASLIVAGLSSLINADSNCPAAATGSTTLILTAKKAGIGFTTSINANPDLALVHTTANHSLVSDLQALQAVSDIWYGLAICSNNANDIEQIAAYIETQKKIFIGVTSDSDVPTSVTTDVGSIMKGKGYKRSALIYSAIPNDGKEAGWMGGELPKIPGSSTFKFKQAVGTTPDVLSQTQRNNLIGQPGVPAKNVNIYETVGGQNIFEEGFMCGGQFIDVTIGIDWLESTMQANVFAQLTQANKIPYTDIGVSVIENSVRQTLKQGADNGLLDAASIEVSAPLVLDIPSADRANRLLPGVTFTARLAGALHFVKITGTVTV